MLATGALIYGWAAAGILVVWFLVKTPRPPVPESLRLAREGIDFDSGRQPHRFFSAEWRRGRNLSDCFSRRIRRRIERRQIKRLRLREEKTGNRLIVDVGKKSIEIARAATDADREWLFGLLADRYRMKMEG